jgi:outer membrane protein assembly factor BamE (lipoprotein component of BamABCDE complex)
MRHIATMLSAVFLTILAGCASFGNPPIQAGEPEQQVITALGTPTHRYQDGKDHLLEYMRGPFGQQTYMARIGPDGRLISYEQVLRSDKFASIKVGQATKQDILRTIGAPSETSYLTLPQLEVWSYPYKEAGVWDSMMHVHFDNAGIVRKMMNGPDPRRDPDTRFPFGMLHMR